MDHVVPEREGMGDGHGWGMGWHVRDESLVSLVMSSESVSSANAHRSSAGLFAGSHARKLMQRAGQFMAWAFRTCGIPCARRSSCRCNSGSTSLPVARFRHSCHRRRHRSRHRSRLVHRRSRRHRSHCRQHHRAYRHHTFCRRPAKRSSCRCTRGSTCTVSGSPWVSPRARSASGPALESYQSPGRSFPPYPPPPPP